MKQFIRLLPIIFLLAEPAFAARLRSGAKRRVHSAPAATAAKSSSSTTEAESEPTAALESVRSKVEIKSGSSDQWRSAKKNSALKSSDMIRTGAKSTARVRLGDGSNVFLLQNSQAELENLSSLQKAIKLIRGRVRAVVKRLKGGNSFQIKTPIGVASVRGTEFEVEFVEEGGKMAVDVLSGQVGVSRLGDLGSEVVVNPGESIKFGAEGDLGNPLRTGAVPIDKQEINSEMVNSRVKDGIVAMAAEESRNADFQTAKSLTDVDGRRVRVEEYIMRPASNQFKLVSLNERDTRFDYFTYTGTFKNDLGEDLSASLKEVNGKLGTTAPTNYLTDYEMLMSNTQDKITDAGTGGHLVKIDVSADGSQYTLTNDDGLGNITSRVVDAATLLGDGSYKIYNPIKDSFELVSASNKDEALKISVLDDGTYRNLGGTDTFWKTRFNTTDFKINDISKTSFAPKNSVTNILAVDLDGTFTNPPISTIAEYPSGSGTLYNKLSLFYSDGTKLEYDNYIIDDEGKVASASDFSGLSTSAAYQEQLLNFNYQQKVKATEMKDVINLVIDPRIGTISGLIQ